MPGLADPSFQKTVTYICEHHENGAMGIIINQPIDLTAKELFSYLDLDANDTSEDDSPLFYGGPVQKERGFVLHSTDKVWEETVVITEDISLTGSKDILKAIANNNGPESTMIALGYAGWDAGQLETEVGTNSWLTVPADKHIIFETDYDKRWAAAARKLGVDVNLIPKDPGHG